MNKLIRITLLVIFLIIIFSLWYLYSAPKPASFVSLNTSEVQTEKQTEQQKSNEVPIVLSTQAPMTAKVEYSVKGFSPKSVTIKQGGTVIFVSTDGSRMWVAADEHPSHIQYNGTSRQDHCPDTLGTAFDQCASGNSYSFTFLKVGDWKYHSHSNANDIGTVKVVQ